MNACINTVFLMLSVFVFQTHMADPHPSPHWEPLVLVPLEDLAAQHWVGLIVSLLLKHEA